MTPFLKGIPLEKPGKKPDKNLGKKPGKKPDRKPGNFPGKKPGAIAHGPDTPVPDSIY